MAQQRIAALKHVATEMAAHGTCHCDPNAVDGKCAYCVAGKVMAENDISITKMDEQLLDEYLEEP